jgi:hypothetical protein
MPLADASKLVREAEKAIWSHDGEGALAYLRGRGLSDQSIEAARLGWTPGVSIPVRDGTRYWRVRGLVIPWLEGDRLALVKIRRPERKPRYAEAFRDGPVLYPTPEAVRPGKPLILTEGEMDCCLVAQEVGDLAAVVTLGSASSKPEGVTYLAMLSAPTWYLAFDADSAGDGAAEDWPARAVRVRPPVVAIPWTGNTKDWGDHYANGLNLRRWWTDRLGGIEAPALYIWDELAQRRWDVADTEPGAGIIVG